MVKFSSLRQQLVLSLWGGGSSVEAAIASLKEEILNTIYRVGSVYITLEDVNPGSFLGGVWEKVSSGKVLQGADDMHTAGTIVEAGLPNITGEIASISGSGYQFLGDKATANGAFQIQGFGTKSGITADSTVSWGHDSFDIDASRSNPIYGASETVQPPAYIVFIWQKISN